MNTLSRLADRRPLIFGLLTLMTWLVLATLLIGVAAFLLKKPIGNLFTQGAGTLAATCILLLMAFRLGWLGKIGLTDFGTWPTWVLTFLLAIYVVFFGWYAFFGEITFELSSLIDSQEARAILLQNLLVGFVEETVFRGVLLFALVRAWGRTKHGLVAAVVVQAALFGALHALQVLGGMTSAAALANVLATFVFGVWLGALVLTTGTLWPAILLHAASNAFTLIKGLSSPWVNPDFLGYLRGASFELPLVLLGVWIMLKVQVHSHRSRSQEVAYLNSPSQPSS